VKAFYLGKLFIPDSVGFLGKNSESVCNGRVGLACNVGSLAFLR